MKRKKRPINNLVVFADTHCGCQLGLCCPAGITLDEGGEYTPSALQLKMWAWWEEFWGEWVPEACHHEPFAVCLAGDALDGVHHGTKTQISQNHTDQAKLAYLVLKPVVEACEGRYYHLRGTEAHGGKSGENEEALAKMLGATPNLAGLSARWDLWFRVGVGLAHVAHTIGVTSSMAYETSAPQKELEQAYVEAARWGKEPPNVVVRAHRHKMTETRVPSYKGYAISCVVAGWQLKTPHVYRLPGGRVTQPQMGGMVIRSGDMDVYTRHKVWGIERDEPEVIEI